jgi:hypothetical protein
MLKKVAVRDDMFSLSISEQSEILVCFNHMVGTASGKAEAPTL